MAHRSAVSGSETRRDRREAPARLTLKSIIRGTLLAREPSPVLLTDENSETKFGNGWTENSRSANLSQNAIRCRAHLRCLLPRNQGRRKIHRAEDRKEPRPLFPGREGSGLPGQCPARHLSRLSHDHRDVGTGSRELIQRSLPAVDSYGFDAAIEISPKKRSQANRG